jgi:ribosomal-protein-alanine N-acetyltransferase
MSTERLLLREFRRDDLAAIQVYASDPEVSRFMPWGPNTIEETAAFLTHTMAQANAQPRTTYSLAIVTDTVIGSISISVDREPMRQQGEMGYVLRRPSWGQGYATEAGLAMLRFGFDNLGLHKIAATCDPENHASARVLTKLGMRREGYLAEHVYIRGEWRDRLLFGKIRDREAS